MSAVEKKHVNMLSHGNTSHSSLSWLCNSTDALPQLTKMALVVETQLFLDSKCTD